MANVIIHEAAERHGGLRKQKEKEVRVHSSKVNKVSCREKCQEKLTRADSRFLFLCVPA